MTARRQVGLFMARDRAAGVLLGRGWRGASRVLAEATCAIDPAQWTAPAPDFAEPLRTLARGLGAQARRADTPVALSLPDPLVREEVMTFQDLPATPAEVEELVVWRFARDHRMEASTIACAWQVMGGDDAGGTRVLVRVLPKALVDALHRDAARAGLRLSVLEAFSRFAMSGGDGVRMSVTDMGDWWSVQFANPDSGASHVQSEWMQAGSLAEAAQRIQRIARSLVLSSGATTQGLTVAAGDDLATELLPGLERAVPLETGTPERVPGLSLADAARKVAVAA